MKLSPIALAILFASLLAGQNAFAQNESLETYEPPPLFAEPKRPPPKIKKAPIDTIAPISREIQETKTPSVKKDKKHEPKVVKKVESVPAPIPNQKPLIKKELEPTEPKIEREKKTPEIQTKFKSINIEPSKTLAEPIELLKAEQPLINEGVVTGPKTMPSIKKKDVLAEEIFINESEVNLIERAQKDEKPLAVIPVQEIAEFSDDKTNLILVFAETQSDLSDNIIENDLFPLAKHLASNTKSLEIKAYASLSTNRPNSDRRLALDRGLAIREFLVAQQIEPHRINLKSFGNNTTRQPADFVEINIVE